MRLPLAFQGKMTENDFKKSNTPKKRDQRSQGPFWRGPYLGTLLYRILFQGPVPTDGIESRAGRE